MILLAFDRDETVETGNRIPGPISISLIKKLHNRPFIDVWAIGNQRLVEEAQIPGLEELARQLNIPYDFIRGKIHIDEHYPRSRFSVKERNIHAKYARLSYLELLYRPFSLVRKIIIDDFDLSANIYNFQHYFPQDFLDFINNMRKGL